MDAHRATNEKKIVVQDAAYDRCIQNSTADMELPENIDVTRVDHILNRFGDSVGDLFKRLGQAARRGFEKADAMSSQFMGLVRDANAIAVTSGWCISTSWPLGLVLDVGVLATNAPHPKASIDRILLMFYQSNNWSELDELVRSMLERGCVHRLRKKRLRDVVGFMRSGDRDGLNAANVLVPALFAQLEGIARDFVTEDILSPEDVRRGKRPSVRQMIEPLRGVALAIEEPGLDLIADRLWNNAKGPALLRDTRHFHAHGHAKSPAHRTEVVRLLLMIDLITGLIERRRAEDSERHDAVVNSRLVYATILSAHEFWQPQHDRPWLS